MIEDNKNEENKTEEGIHIDREGIHVKKSDGEEVHVGKSGVHVFNKAKEHVEFDFAKKVKCESRFGMINSVVGGVSILLAVVVYLLLGFLLPDGIGWVNYWPIILLAPVIPSIILAIHKRKFCVFALPLVVVATYCFIGLQFDMWHPWWILFFLIPCYYMIFGPIDAYNIKMRAMRKATKWSEQFKDIIDEDDDK
ncbi:MAG: hypothetical protein WC366_03010 [Bacilli bacterium]|jgi:hypothetical protein